jgi:dihydrofolate reductase
MTEIKMIVAYNKKGVIGDTEGKIPWHIKEDFQHFKKTTMGCPVIMGRVTYASLPKRAKPLPGRLNIVISRKPLKHMFEEEYQDEDNNPHWFEDIDSAIHHAQKCEPDKDTFIIGGGTIYRHALSKGLVDRVIASEIKGHKDVKGGIFFPDLKAEGWKRKIIEKFEEFTVVELTPPA